MRGDVETAAADVYAFGLLLFELLSREPAYAAQCAAMAPDAVLTSIMQARTPAVPHRQGCDCTQAVASTE